MNFDLVGEVNHLLGCMHKEPPDILKWVPCEECVDGEVMIRTGERMVDGMGGPYEPVEEYRDCEEPGCDEGYVQVDESDPRWEAGTFAHPND